MEVSMKNKEVMNKDLLLPLLLQCKSTVSFTDKIGYCIWANHPNLLS